MKNKKYIFFITVCLLAIVTAILLRNNKEKIFGEKKFVIGVSEANLYEPWRMSMNEEIKDEAKKHNELSMIYKDAASDVEKQKQDIKDLVGFGVDLLIVSINDSKELLESVNEVYKNIPVIVLDRSANGQDYTLYIGTDMNEIGKEAGKLITELAEGKEVKVVEIEGMLNSNTDEEISRGFKEAISKNKNIKIDRTIVGNWNKNESSDKVRNLIQQGSKIDIIFAHNDYMALGAYNALKEQNVQGVKIVGIDGLEGKDNGIDLVKKNEIQGTFICKTGGKEAILYALKILNKEDNIPKKLVFESNVITKEKIN